MESYVVRVWMPDRPGALGQVASRIGAAGGDVVGIDILERGAGRAIDELVVQLPEAGVLPLLLKELAEVDGVDVEDVRPAAESLRDPRLAALEAAAVLVGARSTDELLDVLVDSVQLDFVADWVAVVDRDEPELRAAVGPVPPVAWLGAFVEGSRTSTPAGDAAVTWAPMASARLNLVLGRSGRPLRARERRQVAALARIADARWAEVQRQRHPSWVG